MPIMWKRSQGGLDGHKKPKRDNTNIINNYNNIKRFNYNNIKR